MVSAMARIPDRNSRVPKLIERFGHYVRVFEHSPAFTRAGQLEFHVQAIQMRRQLQTAEAAVANDEFLKRVYETLKAWGIGVRASNLVDLPQFIKAIRVHTDSIAALEGMHLDDDGLDSRAVSKVLWNLVDNLGIVDNNSRIVPGTKTLHHLLPDLVVPVDRKFTQQFFRWHNPEFQYAQEAAFHHSFRTFVTIARKTNPEQYVGRGWNTSRTKVIDNAIVGMLLDEAAGNS